MDDLISLVVAAAIIVSMAVPAISQDAFRLGETRAQVIRKHGSPSSYFSAGHYFSAFPVHARALVWDVYKRRTGGREYEAILLYAPDPEGSRLHPSLLLQEVRINADRPATAQQMAADAPEAVELCRPACRVVAGSDFGGASLVRFLPPATASGGQLALDFSMSGFPSGNPIPVGDLRDRASQMVLWDMTDSTKYQNGAKFKQLTTWPPH